VVIIKHLRHRLGTRLRLRSQKIWIFFFFLLKFNMICTFWIVLMCWCQKWFLKNKKTSLACILARKVIWKAPATTLPNTLLIFRYGLCRMLFWILEFWIFYRGVNSVCLCHVQMPHIEFTRDQSIYREQNYYYFAAGIEKAVFFLYLFYLLILNLPWICLSPTIEGLIVGF